MRCDDEGCAQAGGALPPQQVEKSFVAKLDSPMAGRVAAGRPVDVGRAVGDGEDGGEAFATPPSCTISGG